MPNEFQSRTNNHLNTFYSRCFRPKQKKYYRLKRQITQKEKQYDRHIQKIKLKVCEPCV